MNEVLAKHSGKKIRVFTIWERVMESDQEAPISETLARVDFPESQQFWDPNRVVSKAFGETDDDSIVWDCLYVYPAGTQWNPMDPKPPAHSYTGRPVVDIREAFDRALP